MITTDTYDLTPVRCSDHIELLMNKAAVLGFSSGKPASREFQADGIEGKILVAMSADRTFTLTHRRLDGETWQFVINVTEGFSYEVRSADGSSAERWSKKPAEMLTDGETLYVDYPLLLIAACELAVGR